MKVETTSTLYKELEQVGTSPEAFAQFEKEHPVSDEFGSLSKYLTSFLAANPGLTTSQIYLDSNIARNYGDQFFNGRKEHPGKYKLIPICLAMGMNVKEINRALRLAGQAELDPRQRIDKALIICANEKIHSMMKVNELLISYDIEPII